MGAACGDAGKSQSQGHEDDEGEKSYLLDRLLCSLAGGRHRRPVLLKRMRTQEHQEMQSNSTLVGNGGQMLTVAARRWIVSSRALTTA